MRLDIKNRIVLIGCGKSKNPSDAAAQDIYTGNLFRARRAYAEASGAPWLIASAKHGLLPPDRVISTYDVTIKQLCDPDRAAWALTCVLDVVSGLPDTSSLRGITVELHMGADYAELLRDTFAAVGFRTNWITQGKGIGEQLDWYKSLRGVYS